IRRIWLGIASGLFWLTWWKTCWFMAYDYSPANSSESGLLRYVSRVTKGGPSVPDHGLWFAFPTECKWPTSENLLNRRWRTEGIELIILHEMNTRSAKMG